MTLVSIQSLLYLWLLAHTKPAKFVVWQLSEDKENLELARLSAVSKCELMSDQVTSLQTDLRHKNDLIVKLKRLVTQANLVCHVHVYTHYALCLLTLLIELKSLPSHKGPQGDTNRVTRAYRAALISISIALSHKLQVHGHATSERVACSACLLLLNYSTVHSMK